MNINTKTNEYSSSVPIEAGVSAYALNKVNNPYLDIKTHLEEVISNIISPKELSIDEQINAKFLELDFGSEYDIDASKIGVNDAIFFVNLLNQNNVINYSVQDNTITLNCNEKPIQATNSLLEMLKTSIDSKKPIRLDFENDVTVILRLDKDGKIQAHFIPGTSAVEQYLKNNIPALKQRFDDEQINYSYLGYSQNQNRNSKKKKRSNQ